MRWAVFIAVLICFSCEKLPDEYDNLNGGEVTVIGHGGGGEQNFQNPHPWNSWKSILSGLARDADGIEVDVQLSADSTLMLFHDAQLSPATDCSGCIQSYGSSFLHSCSQQGGVQSSSEYYPLMSLSDLDLRLTELNAHPLICLDLRTFDPCMGFPDAVAYRNSIVTQLISFCEARADVAITSRDLDVLTMLEQADISAELYFDSDLDDSPQDLALAIDAELDGLVVEYEDVDREKVREIHEAGLKVSIYGTFDILSHREALSTSPDAIITDNITLCRQLLD